MDKEDREYLREKFNTIFGKLDTIKETIAELNTKIEVMNEKLENHINREEIHHKEPCETLKEHRKMVWGLFCGFLIVVGKFIFDIIKIVIKGGG